MAYARNKFMKFFDKDGKFRKWIRQTIIKFSRAVIKNVYQECVNTNGYFYLQA